MLSEAVGLTYGSNVRLLIDKLAAGSKRFAINFEQVEFLYLIFQHAQCSARS
jgi:hypothetical protein